jgi:hypothetical protein
MPEERIHPAPNLRTDIMTAAARPDSSHRTQSVQPSQNGLRPQNLGDLIRSALSEAQRTATRNAYGN